MTDYSVSIYTYICIYVYTYVYMYKEYRELSKTRWRRPDQGTTEMTL